MSKYLVVKETGEEFESDDSALVAKAYEKGHKVLEKMVHPEKGEQYINTDIFAQAKEKGWRDVDSAYQKQVKSDIQERRDQINPIASFAAGSTEGLSSGFIDEAAAAVMSPFSDKSYEQIRDDIRLGKQEYKQANPNAYLAGDVAGSVTQGVALGGLGSAGKLGSASKYLSSTASLPQMGIAGVGLGGFEGLGRSDADNIEEMSGDVLEGMAFGGAGGIAIPLAGKGLKSGLDLTSSVLRPVTSKIGGIGDDLYRGSIGLKSKQIAELGDAASREGGVLRQAIDYDKLNPTLKGQEADINSINTQLKSVGADLNKTERVFDLDAKEAAESIRSMAPKLPDLPEGISISKPRIDSNGQGRITVRDGDKEIGHFIAERVNDRGSPIGNNPWRVTDARISSEYQKKAIGLHVLNKIETDLGAVLEPHHNLSAAGKNLMDSFASNKNQITLLEEAATSQNIDNIALETGALNPFVDLKASYSQNLSPLDEIRAVRIVNDIQELLERRFKDHSNPFEALRDVKKDLAKRIKNFDKTGASGERIEVLQDMHSAIKAKELEFIGNALKSPDLNVEAKKAIESHAENLKQYEILSQLKKIAKSKTQKSNSDFTKEGLIKKGLDLFINTDAVTNKAGRFFSKAKAPSFDSTKSGLDMFNNLGVRESGSAIVDQQKEEAKNKFKNKESR